MLYCKWVWSRGGVLEVSHTHYTARRAAVHCTASASPQPCCPSGGGQGCSATPPTVELHMHAHAGCTQYAGELHTHAALGDGRGAPCRPLEGLDRNKNMGQGPSSPAWTQPNGRRRGAGGRSSSSGPDRGSKGTSPPWLLLARDGGGTCHRGDGSGDLLSM